MSITEQFAKELLRQDSLFFLQLKKEFDTIICQLANDKHFEINKIDNFSNLNRILSEVLYDNTNEVSELLHEVNKYAKELSKQTDNIRNTRKELIQKHISNLQPQNTI